MQAAGFGPDDAAEGYALIKRGTQPITGGRPAAGRTVQAALAALADQGMAWVRGVHAVLCRRTPAVAVAVFTGLDDGQALVVVVGTLLDRLVALAADARPEVAPPAPPWSSAASGRPGRPSCRSWSKRPRPSVSTTRSPAPMRRSRAPRPWPPCTSGGPTGRRSLSAPPATAQVRPFQSSSAS